MKTCSHRPLRKGKVVACQRKAAPGSSYCRTCASAMERHYRRPKFTLVVYGTLCERRRLESVIGHPWEGEYEEVVVPGWTKSRHRTGGIWFARPSRDEVLLGSLIRGLSEQDLARLDRYEGVEAGLYRRVLVDVTRVNNRSPIKAFIYADGSAPPDDEPLPCGERPSELDPITGHSCDLVDDGEGGIRSLSLEELLGRPRPKESGALAPHFEPKVRTLAPIPILTPEWFEAPLFAYGALAFRDVLEARIGHHWRGEYEATWVEDYRIESGWPRYLIPEEDGIAHGFLIRGLSEEDVLKIDRFEGVSNQVYERVLAPSGLDGDLTWVYRIGQQGYRRLEERQRRANRKPYQIQLPKAGSRPRVTPFHQ